MPKYRVLAGKHNMKDEKGSPTFVRQGGVVELTEAEAAKFPGKFESVASSTATTPPQSIEGEKAAQAAEGEKAEGEEVGAAVAPLTPAQAATPTPAVAPKTGSPAKK